MCTLNSSTFKGFKHQNESYTNFLSQITISVRQVAKNLLSNDFCVICSSKHRLFSRYQLIYLFISIFVKKNIYIICYVPVSRARSSPVPGVVASGEKPITARTTPHVTNHRGACRLQTFRRSRSSRLGSRKEEYGQCCHI